MKLSNKGKPDDDSDKDDEEKRGKTNKICSIIHQIIINLKLLLKYIIMK